MHSMMAAFRAILLPNQHQTDLLRATLLEGDACHQSWNRWLSAEPSPFASPSSPRRLQPLLWQNLQAQDASLSRDLHTLLSSSHAREEMRYVRLAQALEEVRDLLSVRPLLIKGPVLEETVYPEGSFRHCHDLDLVFDDAQQVEVASRALEAKGWASTGRLLHPCGLPIALHEATAYPPPYRLPVESQERVEWRGVWTLAPHQLLSAVLLQGLSSTARSRLVWACDAYFLARQEGMDWSRLLASVPPVGRLLVYLGLEYLAWELSAPVPPAVLAELEPARLSRVDKNYACWSAARGGGGLLAALSLLPASTRSRLLAGQLFPSPAFLSWAHPDSPAVLRPLWNVAQSLSDTRPRRAAD